MPVPISCIRWQLAPCARPTITALQVQNFRGLCHFLLTFYAKLDSRANFFLAFENLMDALKKRLFLSLRFPASAPLASLFRPSFSVKPRTRTLCAKRERAPWSRGWFYACVVCKSKKRACFIDGGWSLTWPQIRFFLVRHAVALKARTFFVSAFRATACWTRKNRIWGQVRWSHDKLQQQDEKKVNSWRK